ncbi:glycosyltransferase family 2 protein [Actinotalea sp. Marseille-Q4924]|uniref:glycosyltransferase family 2 protein n=1 Tax=Actinotalea sp. Marseille-Q4924 TaxID=2866571 RepID=UPI001CE3D201|nr:glycosyltransferase [Actinotalea sp. Marseille-Q4924]
MPYTPDPDAPAPGDPAAGGDRAPRDPAAAGSAPEDPRVTVVVASMNRRDELLESLGRHRAPVVLVDNGSTDGTAAAVRSAHPHVEVVELPRNVGAAARTIGVRRAATPYVAFADDDSWWGEGSLRTAADALATHPTAALVNASVLVGTGERRDPFCDVLAGSPLHGTDRLPGRRVLGFIACAAMVRRDAFLAVGGFDDVVRFPGEEERVAWDLTAAGWDLAYLPDAVVHHHPSPRRHSPDARVRAITRSALLSAVLRLPWPDVAARWRGAVVGGDEALRLGARDALRDLPRALRHRRVLPPQVLADLDLLAREDELTEDRRGGH